MTQEQKEKTITNEFSYMPVMHCDTCGKDWILADEKDTQCPSCEVVKDAKLIKTHLTQRHYFRQMCADYMGIKLE